MICNTLSQCLKLEMFVNRLQIGKTYRNRTQKVLINQTCLLTSEFLLRVWHETSFMSDGFTKTHFAKGGFSLSKFPCLYA